MCFYGNFLSKTLNFIHIYFADSENKLMFNLEKLVSFEEEETISHVKSSRCQEYTYFERSLKKK